MSEADNKNGRPQPERVIAHADLGLWRASVRVGSLEYEYGFFGNRDDAERLLALAFVKLRLPD